MGNWLGGAGILGGLLDLGVMEWRGEERKEKKRKGEERRGEERRGKKMVWEALKCTWLVVIEAPITLAPAGVET